MVEKGEEPRSSAVKMKIRTKKQTAKEKNGGISRKIKDLRRDVAALLKQKFVKNVVQDLTSGGIDQQREKWQSGLGSKFIHQGEKNAVKYADEVLVLSKGVQDYFKETYGRETHFIPNGVNRPQIREASLITDKFGLKKDSYILFLGRLVPEKGIRYLVEAFKNVKTDKNLVIAGGSSDTDTFMAELKELAKGDDRIRILPLWNLWKISSSS